MKKINLFSRNTDLPSYRRRGLPFPWERGPAEQPGGMGITPSPLSPTKFLKFCGTRFGATPSWKEGEHKVPSYRRMPVSRGFKRGGGIPLFSGMTAVIFALFVATPSFATPTELDKKTVASKAYVDTKQDIIETGLVEFNGNSELMLPAITTYDSTSGLVANKIGILDLETIREDEWNLVSYSPASGYGTEMDNYVPTVRAVAESLQYILDSMPSQWYALSWSVNNDNGVNRTNAINAYNSTFGTGTNQWAGSSEDLIDGQFLAKSLALKQNKIPAGTAGNVVTYSGTAGTVGSVATANAPTYNETTGVLENGTNIATIAAVDTRQKKMTCAGWDSETHTDEHCWLWSIE